MTKWQSNVLWQKLSSSSFLQNIISCTILILTIFFFRSCRQYLPTSPNPRWHLQIVLHIFSNYNQVIIFLHLGREAARCDLWHNNAGLAQIWEGSSQGPDWWKPTIVLKIAKSKSRTDKMQFLKPSRWSRSTRRSWKRWERGTRRRRWLFRSLNVLPSTRSARSVEVHMTIWLGKRSLRQRGMWESCKLFGWHCAERTFNP